MCTNRPFFCITPPHLLEKLLGSDDLTIREAALETLLSSATLRGEREAVPSLMGVAAAPDRGRRTIFDMRHSESLFAAVQVRTENSAVSQDDSVNRAFDGLGATRKFYADVFDRDSIDGAGMRLDGYVHYGRRYNNAFWDGRRMSFGDGDGQVFSDLTGSLDVIGHELTHGVTETTAGLEYHNQSGALNESISDVFGSLVKQYSRNQTAEAADWLIGDEVFTPQFAGDALRSMKAPGTAYDNPVMGKDPQPGHMKDFVSLPDTPRGDNGGVHINSGIPNHAFYLVATTIGGPAWKAAGHIWYESLKASSPNTEFQQFADTTVAKAAQLYGAGSAEQKAVLGAWDHVGLTVRGMLVSESVDTGAGDTLAEISKKLEQLSADVQALTLAVRGNAKDDKTVKPGSKTKAR